ncbi:F-box/FBD/LRR-repeat protein At4g00160-like [Cornus florida]|uniref:F-box/FBD/LRR-repeat protein At4g00160-like n=1 Tax=Cornus florida TaxID=4283 RepID=UPI002898FA91|nr:F-box/FBD/LRR-repeat protein At4g00160-like [Cornus florida]
MAIESTIYGRFMQKTISSNPMEKSTLICCVQNASEKDDKGGLCLEDRINGLPDVILISILSLLTMKEAGRSSLLSKRWRYIWTYIAALNFDASHIIDAILLADDREKEVEAQRPLYLSWINQVVKSHKAPTIDEFRVHFDFDVTCRFDIDNWLDFFLGFTNCISLTKLMLSNVDVTGQVLKYLLINCPFLEQLFVEEFESLVNLKVPDLAVKLKLLEINLCFNVDSIEIHAMNLVLFKYFGDLINIPFKND